MKRFPRKRLLPGALVVVACGSPSIKDAGTDAGADAGYDAGYDGGTRDGGVDAGNCPSGPINDAGMKCVCEPVILGDGGQDSFECCDPDIGNPCPVCCLNPREADGGRQYQGDSGIPVCFC